MKKILLALYLLVSIGVHSQNKRDLTIKDSILPILNSDKYKSKPEYVLVKNRILALEKQYGYETFLKKRLLDASFFHNDESFFKKELTVLVRDYGFDIIYMKGSEPYFDAIMTGNLSAWFKKTYVKKHVEWMKENFEKQRDIKQLYDIQLKDQVLATVGVAVLNETHFDAATNGKIRAIINTYYANTLAPLFQIAQKNGQMPNDKNFALLQHCYDTALIHNFQASENIEKTWEAYFPMYKTAYLKNEVENLMFENYDFYAYRHFGYQVFGSYTIDQIPQQFRKSDAAIPIRDESWLQYFRTEAGWDKQ